MPEFDPDVFMESVTGSVRMWLAGDDDDGAPDAFALQRYDACRG